MEEFCGKGVVEGIYTVELLDGMGRTEEFCTKGDVEFCGKGVVGIWWAE